MDLRKDKQEEEVMGSSKGEYRCQTDETSRDETRRKGKGKGTGGKGEHDSEGRLGSKGARWDTRSTDEQGEGTGAARTMKSDDDGEERGQVDPEQERQMWTRKEHD